MTILYDIIYGIYVIFYFPYLFIRGKWHEHFSIRFGSFPEAWMQELKGKKSIWIHAVSVGEVLVVSNLVKRLKQNYPHHVVICSTVTKTGNQVAFEVLGKDCLIVYAPLDFSWIVRKFIRVFQPSVYISAETEIWPNLYSALHKASVPIVQINGRISDQSFKGYKRLLPIMKRILSCVDLFYMQSALDAERIRQLGAPGSKVFVTGNLKFDLDFKVGDIALRDLGLSKEDRLFVAGSTHPGEEEIILSAYKKAKSQHDELRCIIAPRHVERAGEVGEIIKEAGLKPHRLSDLNGGIQLSDTDVIVVDTIGNLRSVYGLGHFVFVGKSLKGGGGQNMIEPAYLGKPTMVGPMTQNFKDAMYLLKKNGAIAEVNNEGDISDNLIQWLNDPKQAQAQGDAAKKTILENQGATDKTLRGISELLTKS